MNSNNSVTNVNGNIIFFLLKAASVSNNMLQNLPLLNTFNGSIYSFNVAEQVLLFLIDRWGN